MKVFGAAALFVPFAVLLLAKTENGIDTIERFRFPLLGMSGVLLGLGFWAAFRPQPKDC